MDRLSYRISATPERVAVSDSRGFVPGARVRVLEGWSDLLRHGEVIPPEGDCPEAWLGDLASLPDELYGELECAARAGARGKRFRCEVEL